MLIEKSLHHFFRGLRLPDSETPLDPVSRFQERMTAMKVFLDAFLGLYDVFLAERTSDTAWQATQREIHRWVADRATRK